ncbi:glycosyltransferase family 39 protein [Aurantiacibacter poecillastricola]|uniref:glycosyltransferase family 39 protein n=1 Tax=Aurantiacibacter poecillastricola TaxID=3064385 RepID=UPI00273E54F7|nr:glycosyltransferase family 39 protein [Aurantiacibacter sp. 219JJ12-13]MDP5262414.1 glycosyltransferase family 39 protein [Aurantiacibacter sp. 219JJ12-13]
MAARTDETNSLPALHAERGGWLAPAVILALVACIAGRVLAYPINRDEHMFVSVAQQLPGYELYRDLGYNHLPNFPLLLSAIFELTGTDHYLLASRLVVIASWALSFILLWLIGRRLGVSVLASITAIVLLGCNVPLLGPPGMLATNSLVPIPFSFLAFYLVLGAFDPRRPPKRRMIEGFLAGVAVSVAIGLKANFIVIAPCFFVASLLAGPGQRLIERIKLQALPLGLGGLVGGLPPIIHFLRDTEGMVAHSIYYFTVLHTSFWADSTEPKVMSIADKVLLAENIWLGGTTMLAAVGLMLLAMRGYRETGWAGAGHNLWRWPVLLALALTAGGVVIAVIPSPSFSQYFVPPIPFLILTMLTVIPREENGPVVGMRLLAPLLLLGLIAGSLRLLPGLAQLVGPGSWTGVESHAVMHETLDNAGVAQDARIATMSPILAIEGGREVYPEFAAGQFVYRVAPYLTDEFRQYYRTTSPGKLEAFLDSNPPDAILVDTSEAMEQAFVEYAQDRDMREIAVDKDINSLRFRLFVPK